MGALPEAGILSFINKTPAPGPCQVMQSPEVPIIAGLFTGQQGVQRMVEIIVPLGVQGESPNSRGRMMRVSFKALSAMQ